MTTLEVAKKLVELCQQGKNQVRFSYDLTSKPMNKRFKMDEVAVFTVKDDKIVREEFFYVTG